MLLAEGLDQIIINDEVKSLDLSKYDGWERVHFPEGTQKYIHVNRHAIMRNMKEDANYPTIIVLEEGVEHQYHHAVMFGAVSLEFDRYPQSEGVRANVYMETHGKILCFKDPLGPSFLTLDPRKPDDSVSDPRYRRLGKFVKNVIKFPFVLFRNTFMTIVVNTPVLECLVDPERKDPRRWTV